MSHDPSFFSDEAQGGIRGGRGYTAQTVVLLHRLPALFGDAEFEGAVCEGQEDFDLHFQRSGKKRLRVVQCKAKPLANPDVRKILDGMYERFLTESELYEQFELVAQVFPPQVEAVRQGAVTLRQARQGYDGTVTEKKTTLDFRQLVEEMLAELKCTSGVPVDWIINQMSFSTKIPSFPFAESEVVDPFAAQCADCRQFGVQILAPFRVAAALLHQQFTLHLRELLTRQALANIVHDACVAYKDKVQREGVKLHLDHWRDQDGKAISTADQVFEWRAQYDAAKPSGIPTPEVTQALLDELQTFESDNMTVWKEAEVQLLAPCSLSAAFVVGHTYRRTKGYALSAVAVGSIWSFDTQMAPSTEVQLQVTNDVPGQTASVAVVALGVGRGIAGAVEQFVTQSGLTGRFLAYRSSLDHLSEPTARRVAADFISALRDLHSEGTREIHLFYAGPMALAAMIGTLINKIGVLKIYELDYQGEYKPVFTLWT